MSAISETLDSVVPSFDNDREPDMHRCRNCGRDVDADTDTCHNCSSANLRPVYL